MATAADIRVNLSAQNSASKEILKVEKDLNGLSRQATRTGTSFNASGAKMGSSMGMVGKRAGMAGIQIQQLVGQIQGGTNVMTAMSMQGADLGFVLGYPLVGAIVGIGSSIAGMLIPALLGATTSTEDLVEEIDALIDRDAKLSAAQRAFKIDLLYDERRKAMLAASEAAGELAKVDKDNVKEIRRLNALIDTENQKFYELERQIKNVTQGRKTEDTTAKDYLETLKQQADLLGKNTLETIMYTANLKKLNAEEKLAAFNYAMKIQNYEDEQKATKEAKSELDSFIESTELSQKAAEDYAAKGLKGMEDGLIDLIAGTKSASNAFKDMATSIINELMRMQIRKSITGPLANVLDKSIGNFFNSGKVEASVNVGSPVKKATGGAAQSGRPYIVGERGPELFIPGRTGAIMPNGSGGGGVNVTLNLSTGVSQTVRAEVANMLPQIAAATKAAVADARMRGGSYSSAMGV